MREVHEKKQSGERCISRRKILKAAGCAGASAIIAGGTTGSTAATNKVYPQVKVANIRDLGAGRIVEFDYPLIGRKSIIMDIGCNVEGGVGPNSSIVAYSKFCTHLGCGVEFDRERGNLVCECHQTEYDPKRSGKIIQGPAPNSLPKIFLRVDSSTGDIYAIGAAGLIYGLRNNLLDGEEVS